MESQIRLLVRTAAAHGAAPSAAEACSWQPALITAAALLGVHPEILKRKLSFRLMTSGRPTRGATPFVRSAVAYY